MLDTGSNPRLYAAAAGGEQNRYLNLLNSPTSPSASGLKAGGLLVADDFSFGNPGKNDVVIKGNVAIGTGSLANKLTVFSSGYGIEQTNGTVRLGTYLNSQGGWLGTINNFPLNFFVNNGQPLMSITGANGDGTVVIGRNQNLGGAELVINGDNFGDCYPRSGYN